MAFVGLTHRLVMMVFDMLDRSSLFKKMNIDIDCKHQSVQHCHCSVISCSQKPALTILRFDGWTEDCRSSCNEVEIVDCIPIGVQTKELLARPKVFHFHLG